MEDTRAKIAEIAAGFAAARRERQARRWLDPADFAALRDAGFLLAAVPEAHGGTWRSVEASVRPIAEMLRVLARGDASVALVAAMHPAVLFTCRFSVWASAPDEGWQAERERVFEGVRDGEWWGTITSEPGSGGDMAKTRAVASRSGDGWALGGAKHFGSGAGIVSRMMTTAVPEGEDGPELFTLDVRGVLDARGVPAAGARGVTLVAPWDGAGMIATQSHALRFDGFPVRRLGGPGFFAATQREVNAFNPCVFASVIVGVVDAAVEEARGAIASRRGELRAYEQVEWARAEVDAWLIAQAFEGMLRDVELGGGRNALKGKLAISELAEGLLTRISRVLGGGTFTRTSPFSCWLEDVRALGFLRPPWGLTYDKLISGA